MAMCPICNQNDRRCKLTDLMAICHNSDGTGTINGFVAVEQSPKGKGWVWEPKNITDAERKIQSLESEFEEVKTKYQQALERVETLTKEWEDALPENKKEAHQKLKNAKDIVKSLNSTRYSTRIELRQKSIKPKGEAETSFAKDYGKIIDCFDGRFSYDILHHQLMLDNEIINFESASVFLTDRTGGFANWNKSDDALTRIIMELAKRNEFCPAKEYLTGLENNEDLEKYFSEEEPRHHFLTYVAQHVLGLESKVQIAAFRAQLVGSVKRIFEPGCIHRLMPIIYSKKQEAGKSTFIRYLYGDDFFGEGKLQTSGNDGPIVLQRVWGFEFAECDPLFKTRDSSELKDFISRTSDTYRAPYARAAQKHYRRSVIWGTTNHRSFLTDTTGNTRYPILEIPDGYDIPTNWVRENRDLIWLAALDGYRSGIENQLPKDLIQMAADESLEFTEEDALGEKIKDVLDTLHEPKITMAVLGDRLGYEPFKFTPPEQRRVGGLLSKMGWKKTRPWVNGERLTFWVKEC